MPDIVFAMTRYRYETYCDYYKVVELSGFETCYVDEIDFTRRALYIVSPLNGEYRPHRDNHRNEQQNAKLVTWCLERPGPDGLPGFYRANKEVLDQGYFDEVWLSDRWMAAYCNDQRIRYLGQENQERSVARNTGIGASKGEYISFLDSDDEYLPHKLEAQVPILDEDPEIGMVLSGWLEADDEGNVLHEASPWLVYPDPLIDLRAWLLSGPVYFGATLVRRTWLVM